MSTSPCRLRQLTNDGKTLLLSNFGSRIWPCLTWRVFHSRSVKSEQWQDSTRRHDASASPAVVLALHPNGPMAKVYGSGALVRSKRSSEFYK